MPLAALGHYTKKGWGEGCSEMWGIRAACKLRSSTDYEVQKYCTCRLVRAATVFQVLLQCDLTKARRSTESTESTEVFHQNPFFLFFSPSSIKEAFRYRSPVPSPFAVPGSGVGKGRKSGKVRVRKGKDKTTQQVFSQGGGLLHKGCCRPRRFRRRPSFLTLSFSSSITPTTFAR